MTRERRHTGAVREIYARILAGSPLTGRYVEVEGRRVHVVAAGDGPPLVLLHGTGGPALFYRPLLERLPGVRVLAPERPGQGLSEPAELPRTGYRRAAVTWMERLFDALELGAATLVGHSMGGLWSLWYALEHPTRVSRLVLLGGPPALPGGRAPLPYRIMATPGLGWLAQRLSPPSEKSLLQFARMVGEDGTLADYPDLVKLLVTAGRDPLAADTDRNEVHAVLTPYVLLSPSRFRRESRIATDELQQLRMPVLLIWGEREPVGGVPVARNLADLLPHARLELLDAGHAPWLGHAHSIAPMIADFAREASPSPALAPPT
ncbi:MAG TPA: alpha/beta hydrolase [Solirubrobacterales bacterium]|nr:alpha/beta hydrolase [Solirubrobacterales bacterium]